MPEPRGRDCLADGATPLTVGLVAGSRAAIEAGGHCGVRDYTARLAQALAEVRVHAKIVSPPTWGMRDGAGLVRSLRAARLDILHLQYPSLGHRHSLVPHLLGLCGVARACVVTLHEHSQLPLQQRMANHLFRGAAGAIMFTTRYEADAFGAGSDAVVIPIGSNIPSFSGPTTRKPTIVYFGQVRPNKGIEEFLSFGRRAKAEGQASRIAVIGSTPPRWHDYRNALRADAIGVDWMEDVSPGIVAAELSAARAAYLPFPDGVSLRRGSLLAALANGLPVIAPIGPGTTDDLQRVVLTADTPEAALLHLRALNDRPDLADRCDKAGRALVEQFHWSTIAGRHVALYGKIMRRRDRSGEPLTVARAS